MNLTIVAVFVVGICLANPTPTVAKSSEKKVRFELYNNPDPIYYPGYGYYLPPPGTRMETRFKPGNNVKVIIHGFEHNGTCWVPQEIKDVYLQVPNNHFDVIAIDWGYYATPITRFELLNYALAVNRISTAAQEIADFLSSLRKQNIIEHLSKVHIVGFSLGAHVSGQVGKKLFEAHNEKVGRITGLDPAGPVFSTGLFGRPLDKNDADYVDVIHTCMGELGIVKSIGLADFFVNSGFHPQPGCSNTSCSHAAAPNYFMQSILNDRIQACPCSSETAWVGKCKCNCLQGVPFGEHSVPGTTGTFCLSMVPVELSGRYSC